MAIPQPSGLARRDRFFSMSRESSRSGTTAPRSSASNPSAAAGANRPAAAARPAVAAVPLVAAVTPRASSDCSRIETPSESDHSRGASPSPTPSHSTSSPDPAVPFCGMSDRTWRSSSASPAPGSRGGTPPAAGATSGAASPAISGPPTPADVDVAATGARMCRRTRG